MVNEIYFNISYAPNYLYLDRKFPIKVLRIIQDLWSDYIKEFNYAEEAYREHTRQQYIKFENPGLTYKRMELILEKKYNKLMEQTNTIIRLYT